MKKILYRVITLSLVAVLLLSSSFSFAATTTQEQSDAKDALAKLILLGVIDNNDLSLNGKLTRAVFSKIIVNSTGNYDLAAALTGSSTFSDVSAKSKYCGYINAATNLGFLSAYSDGKFKPDTSLTYAQLCTAMVKALGYSGSDIVGAWPTGYIDKAKNLGLTNGFSYSNNSELSAYAALVMIDRMLNTNIKKSNAQAADVTLLDSVGLMDDQSNWIYGKPEVALNFNATSMKLGSIKFVNNIPILRDTVNTTVSPATKVVGETISLSDIKDKDVVYEVYNKNNVLMYYLVVDNKIDGQLTSILPSKYSPKKIQINNVDYELGKYAKLNKFNSSRDAFNVGDTVTAVLGYDGKVVDAYYNEDSTTKDYAFVTKTSTMVSKEAVDYGKVNYTVDLMHVDGTTKTYKIDEDPSKYYWQLVKFSLVTDEKVALMTLGYITASDTTIDRYQKKINQSYITDNVKIFNYTDSTVNILKWTDIPDGTLASGTVKYLGTTGDFGDVNIILTSDVLNQQFKNYVVTKIQTPNGKNITNYTYSLSAGADQCTYSSKTEIPGAVVGAVFNMRMYNNTVSTFNKIQTADGQGWYIQAIDSKRLKMGEYIYMFNTDVGLYLTDYSGNIVAKRITDITTGTTTVYGSIKIYCDRPINNGGKVQFVIFSNK